MKARRRNQLPEWKPWHSLNLDCNSSPAKQQKLALHEKDDRDNNLPSFFYFIVA